eukprot:gene1477-1634_t
MDEILELITDFAFSAIQDQFEDENIYKSKHCGKSFKKVATLRKHLKSKHSDDAQVKHVEHPLMESQEKKCQYCGKETRSQSELQKQMTEFHPDPLTSCRDEVDQANQTVPNNFVCEICGRSYKRNEREAVMTNFDIVNNAKKPSGKNRKCDTNSDIIALSQQLVRAEIFRERPGSEVKGNGREWKSKKLKHFKELNVYAKL